MMAMKKKNNVKVLIVGAGPSGLATAACLTSSSIPYIILEREDCYASLWKKRAYDRLSLHLAKSFCTLPLMPHLPKTSTFMSKAAFISYLDDYVSKFDINPLYFRSVELAYYDEAKKKWRVEAKNSVSGKMEVYAAEFLVVATGENDEAYIPELRGLESFHGDIIHSSHYACGEAYKQKHVLVVGCGNSGMEISNDLYDYGAHTSVVVRSPLYVLSKRMVHAGMLMAKFMPVQVVDSIISVMARLAYGDLSRYGIHQPLKFGPFQLKSVTGKTPVIDTGSLQKIRSNQIKVVPGIVEVNGNNVVFENGDEHRFDAIIFATGYRSVARKWLKDYKYVLEEDGLPKYKYPNHWKGEKGLYCLGMLGKGLAGVSSDATAIANDITKIIKSKRRKRSSRKGRQEKDVVNNAFISKFHLCSSY